MITKSIQIIEKTFYAAVINFALESNDVALATALPDGEYMDQVYGTAFVVGNGILKGTAQPETTYILSL